MYNLVPCVVQLFIYSSFLKDIKVPSGIKKRECPRGRELTVVGLPEKKNRSVEGPCPFIQLHTSDKEKGECLL